MSEQIKQIASRICELRKIAEMDADEVARALGIAPEIYSRYEKGEEDIPASLLYSIAALHNVELASLLTGEEPRLHIYTLVRKNKGVKVERRSDYHYQNLAHNFIHKKAEPFLVQVDPKPAGEMHVNSHPGQEFDYMLEGRLAVSINGREVVLSEGDCLYYDSNYPHGMRALDEKPARFLAVIL